MIYPSHHPFWQLFYDRFSSIAINLRFHRFNVQQLPENLQSQSVLLIGNHISWWDGFINLHLANHYLGKQFHVIMLERELKKRLSFSRAGAFSIGENGREHIESLNHAIQVLKSPDNLVLFYPQGAIHSHYESRLTFQPGIQFLIKRLPDQTSLVMQAVFFEYGTVSKPSIYIFLQSVENPKSMELDDLESTYNQFLNDSRLIHQNNHHRV